MKYRRWFPMLAADGTGAEGDVTFENAEGANKDKATGGPGVAEEHKETFTQDQVNAIVAGRVGAETGKLAKRVQGLEGKLDKILGALTGEETKNEDAKETETQLNIAEDETVKQMQEQLAEMRKNTMAMSFAAVAKESGIPDQNMPALQKFVSFDDITSTNATEITAAIKSKIDDAVKEFPLLKGVATIGVGGANPGFKQENGESIGAMLGKRRASAMGFNKEE